MATVWRERRPSSRRLHIGYAVIPARWGDMAGAGRQTGTQPASSGSRGRQIQEAVDDLPDDR